MENITVVMIDDTMVCENHDEEQVCRVQYEEKVALVSLKRKPMSDTMREGQQWLL